MERQTFQQVRGSLADDVSVDSGICDLMLDGYLHLVLRREKVIWNGRFADRIVAKTAAILGKPAIVPLRAESLQGVDSVLRHSDQRLGGFRADLLTGLRVDVADHGVESVHRSLFVVAR